MYLNRSSWIKWDSGEEIIIRCNTAPNPPWYDGWSEFANYFARNKEFPTYEEWLMDRHRGEAHRVCEDIISISKEEILKQIEEQREVRSRLSFLR